MKQLRILGGLTALFAAFATAQPAQAGFGHHGYGSYGSYGSGVGYGSSGAYAVSAGYGSSGYASYGSSGSAVYSASYGSSGAAYGSSGGYGSSGSAHVGPVRRLATRIHAHHAAKVAARASYGSSGAAYGSSGSGYVASYGSSGSVSYGSSGSYVAPSYGSSGSYVAPSYGSSGGGSSGSYMAPVYGGSVYSETIVNETPVVNSYRVPLETVAMDSDTALLTVAVDENAVVTVNGMPTKSAGPIRQFMSNGLKEGFVYSYEVKVSYPGSDAADTKTVKLRAGSAERLVFSKPATEDKTAEQAVAPETVVILHVPEDAKVVLAGNETNGAGEVRTFRTRQLAAGQNWSDYTIRVTATVRGAAVTKVKSIDLKAGDHQDLVFDFETESVASR